MTFQLMPAPLDVEFKIVNPDLEKFGLPQYETEGAAALDIRAFMDEETVEIAPGETFMFKSGFAFHIGNPWIAAIVLPRSGTGRKGTNLKNTLGLIDSDYQGELSCTAINTNASETDPIKVTRGDRIFQLVFTPIVRVNPRVVAEFSAVSARGTGGFGSTGTK